MYWEGAVLVSGEREGRPVSGVGYLEMTGYVERSALGDGGEGGEDAADGGDRGRRTARGRVQVVVYSPDSANFPRMRKMPRHYLHGPVFGAALALLAAGPANAMGGGGELVIVANQEPQSMQAQVTYKEINGSAFATSSRT